ncbi:MAG: hypothetical protein MJZ28_08525 [Paludibacteraceae bacterium]|nr:hypothetical protein [Paludibacteraceae bacterium]
MKRKHYSIPLAITLLLSACGQNNGAESNSQNGGVSVSESNSQDDNNLFHSPYKKPTDWETMGLKGKVKKMYISENDNSEFNEEGYFIKHVESLDALVNVKLYTYDAAGNLITRISYDPSCKEQSTMTSQYSYKMIGDTLEVTEKNSTNYGTDVCKYYYTEGYHCARYSDSNGNSTRYIYDKHGNIIEYVNNDGSSTKNAYKYDDNDRLIETAIQDMDEDFITTKYFYDDAGKLKKTESNSNITNIYNEKGDIEETISAEGSWKYSYDEKGNLTGYSQNGEKFTTTHQYEYYK